MAIPNESLSFLEGVRTITTAGDAGSQAGMGTHLYLITRSMEDEYFYNADGEMLFVPQQGELRLWTEFGIIDIEPGEIALIPRGVKLRIELKNGFARGCGSIKAMSKFSTVESVAAVGPAYRIAARRM